MPPELAEILGRLKRTGECDAEAKRLAQLACAHTTNILERDAAHLMGRLGGLTVPAPCIEPFPPSTSEAEAALRISELLQKRLGSFFAAAVFDNVFSSVVVLNGIPGCVDDLACGISILDSMTVWHSSMQGAIFLLGPQSLALMGISTYADDPLKMGFPKDLAFNAEPFFCLQSGQETPFSAHRRTYFRTEAGVHLAPAQPLLGALYLESLSHFLRTWRSLLEPGPGGSIYAVSRSVSFWLYFVKKIPLPCFPLQPLIDVFKREKKLDPGCRIFEASLSHGLQTGDIEVLAALNAETLHAAASEAGLLP
jgi:hypothetical protein